MKRVPPVPASKTSLKCHYNLLFTYTSDGFGTGGAALGKELPEAVGAIRLVVSRRELLPGQLRVAVGASEALPVPSLVFERDAARRHNLLALCAFGGKLFLEIRIISTRIKAVESQQFEGYLEARNTVDVCIVWNDEGLAADGHLAHGALEALVVPLSRLVLHFFHARPEGVATRIAPENRTKKILPCFSIWTTKIEKK